MERLEVEVWSFRMTASDRERARLEKLEALKAENHITPEDARREDGCGPRSARREELAARPSWKVKHS